MSEPSPDTRSNRLAFRSSRWFLHGSGVWIITALVAIIFGCLALAAAKTKGAAFDEPAYLAAGYSHWAYNDHRLTVYNGPLPHLVQGLPLWLMEPNFVSLDNPIWKEGQLYPAGRALLYFLGNDGQALLMVARAANALFGVGLILIVFAWARHLWGNGGGLLAAILAALSPTLLAQNGVATSDMALTFFFYLGAYCFWKSLRVCTLWSATGVIIAVTGALTSKLTGPLLLGVFLGIAVIELIFHQASTLQFWEKVYVLRTSVKRGFMAASLVIISLMAAWGAVWAMHGFRYSAFAPGLEEGANFSRSWETVMPISQPLAASVTLVREHKLLPEGYLWGLCAIYAEAHKRSAWLHGEYSETGWRSYFPIAYGIKSTPTELLLSGLFLGLLVYAGIHAVRRKDAGVFTALAPLAIIAGIYWTLSITNKVNIGHRHLLPVYPLLFIGSGWLLWKAGHWRRVLALVAGILLAGQAAEVMRSAPHYSSYFNQTIGGPSNGWQWLVDSSLDWGQDLSALQAWNAAHPAEPGEPRYVAYFGMDCLQCVTDGFFTSLPSVPLQVEERPALTLKAGTYVISATMLACVYIDGFPGPWNAEYEERFAKAQARLDQVMKDRTGKSVQLDKKFWTYYERARFAKLCDYLRQRGPDSQITPALLVYNLTADELTQALLP